MFILENYACVMSAGDTLESILLIFKITFKYSLRALIR